MTPTAAVLDAAPTTGAIRTRDRAISWPAIAGGAVAAAALSLILLALGTGLGLSSISPWSYEGASGKAVGIAGAAWLLIMAAAASGLGGYLAGRLRAKWPDVDTDETYFRDTAHGFLAWAAATIISAAVLTSAASSMVGAATNAAAVAGGRAVAAGTAGVAAIGANPSDAQQSYFVDMMFRGAKPAEAGVDANSMRREASAIVSNAMIAGTELSPADRTYLAQLVANRTGISATEAEQRVAQTTSAAKAAADTAAAKAREAADVARKATATTALWVFVSLLLGAFCAALAATWGGRRRDAAYPVRP